MRFLHCSDVHLGRKPVGGQGDYSRKRYEDYFSAFEWAVKFGIEKKVDVFIISGDFFDKKELQPEVLEKAEHLLLMLKNAAICTVLVEGNHDNISSGSENESWLVYLQNKGLFERPFCYYDDGYKFHYFEKDAFRFYGLGYPGSFVDETLEALADQLNETEADKNIVIVHTAIGSASQFPGTVRKEKLELLKGKLLYLACGHFHFHHVSPAASPFYFVPGSLEYWDSNEFSQEKGVIIFDTDSRTHEFISSQRRHAAEFSIDIICDRTEDAYEEIEKFLASLSLIEGESIVKLNINLLSPLLLETEKIEEMLSAKGALKSFIRINLSGDTTLTDYKNPYLTIRDIEKEIIGTWNYFSDKSDLVSEKLDALKKYQSSSNQEQFHEHFESLLNAIIESEGGENEN